MNIITQVGFGRGEFRLVGGRGGRRHNFLVPPLGENNTQEVALFKGPSIKRELSIHWFISFVICEDKPGLCSGGSSARGASPSESVFVVNSRY